MNVKFFRKKLLDERARLHKDLDVTSTVSAADHVGYSTHQADDASDVFEQTKNATVHDQLDWLLAEVDHALAKFEQGTYGLCEECGKPIHEARLEALPTARLCMTDQQKHEKKVIPS
jgi:RNA polymerase-binding protein DksA